MASEEEGRFWVTVNFNCLWKCGELTLSGWQMPTQPLSHSHSSTAQEEKIKKCSQVKMKRGRLLISHHHEQTRLLLEEINLMYHLGITNGVGEISWKPHHPYCYLFLGPASFLSPPPLPKWCREMGQGELWLVRNNLTFLLLFPHIIPMLQHGVPPTGTRASQTAPRWVLPTSCSTPRTATAWILSKGWSPPGRDTFSMVPPQAARKPAPVWIPLLLPSLPGF